MSSPRRVLIAGGGVAGLETMLALHALAPDRVEVTLVSDREDYAYEPLSVGAPFGVSEVRHYALDELAARHGARFTRAVVTEVDPGGRLVRTDSAGDLPYDDLLVALERAGPRRCLALSPSMASATLPASTISWRRSRRAGSAESRSWRRRTASCGRSRSTSWRSMTAGFAAERGVAAEISLVTPAPAPLGLFGAPARERMAQLLAERGIQVHAGFQPRVVQPGRLLLEPDGPSLEVDRVVAVPRLVGPDVPGLPGDADGFIPTEPDGRVTGTDGLYAAGDCIAFPVKQGGLAAQEADAAAESIAAGRVPTCGPSRSGPFCAASCSRAQSGSTCARTSRAANHRSSRRTRSGGRRPRWRAATSRPHWGRSTPPR